MKSVASFFIFAISVLPTFAKAAIPVYDLLSNRRAMMTLPAYGASEKQLIADQALYFIQNYYIHCALKEKAFGIDPIGALTEIQKNASSLNDADLHAQLEKVFSSLRDLHTNYYYPKPTRCFRSLLPFSLEFTTDENGKSVVAVSQVSAVGAVLALAPDTKKIATGDILESFSDQDPLVAMSAFYEVGAGANDPAQLRRALQVLVSRSHSRVLVPESNTEHLKFKRFDGTEYEIDLPWVSNATLSCLPVAPPAPLLPSRKMKDTLGLDNEQNDFNKVFAKKLNDSTSGFISTAESSIRYKIVNFQGLNYAVMKMDSFDPSLGDEGALKVISDLLRGPFQTTEGLIIDLRDNGGGSISFGERMLQFFTAQMVSTETFELLANDANKKFIQSTSSDSGFLKLIDLALNEGRTVSLGAPLTSAKAASNLGQFFLKPVAILTNSACFSTCDMFTAGMQDNGLAKIWSIDGQTGGGGANVMAYSGFQEQVKAGEANPFVALPGGQDMRLAWRRAIRTKKNQGVLLENVGVIADETIAATLSDLVNSSDAVILKKITNDLKIERSHQVAKDSNVLFASESRIDYHEGDVLSFDAQVSGTTWAEFWSDGKFLFKQAVNQNGAALKKVSFQVPATLTAGLGTLGQLELRGYLDQSNDAPLKVWRKIVNYRKIPSASLALPVKLDLSSGSLAPLTSYSNGVGAWTIQNGVLRIGNGPEYKEETDSEADLFLALTPGSTPHLHFSAEVHSEQDYDFFNVKVIVNGKETKLVSLSGDVALKDYDFDLSAYSGQNIEIRFEFLSDGGVNASGPLLGNISVQ